MSSRIKNSMRLCAIAAAVFLGGGMQLHAAGMKADTVYHGGKIYTITEDFHKPSALDKPDTAEVVATLNGQIIFAGSEADARSQGLFDKGNAVRIVDLKGKTMLPGFVDGHSHFPNQGRIDLFQVNLNSPPIGKMNSIEDYITALSEAAERTEEGKVINGVGYDDTLVGGHPTKEDLDRASTKHPIVALHTSEHLRAVNSLALENSGLYSKDINEKGVYVNPKNGKEYPGVHTRKTADGWELTGVFAESEAMGLLNAGEAPTVANSGAKAVARTSQVYAASGITTADQGAGVFAMPAGATADGNILYAGYNLGEVQSGLAQGVMGVRLILHPFGYMNIGGMFDLGEISRMALGWTGTGHMEKSADSPSVGDDITTLSLTNVMGGQAPEGLPADRIFLGTWKFVYDGSNQGYTGYFKSPGYWDPGYGGYDPSYDGLPSAVTYTKEELEKWVDFYHGKSEPIEVHTNGSQAAEDFITALEKAVAAHPTVKDTRHTSIHAQMMERQHIERLVGDYSKLDSTADMYENLSGAAVDTDLRAKLENGKLMREQNLINSYFINHAYFWGDRHLDIFMGPGRGKNMNPAGWSVAMDHLYTFHNDTTVTPISPLRSLQSAVERVSAPTALGAGGTLVSGEGKDLDATAMYPEVKDGPEKAFWNYDQRINVLQALHGLTIVPAYQNRLEDRIGSIKEGKFADFVILDSDPFVVEPSRLAAIRVASTIVGDEVVHGVLPDDESFASQLAPAYIQPNGVTVSEFDSKSIDAATAEKKYASLPEGAKRLGTFEFNANVNGKSAVFQMNFLGNGEAVDTMSLLKLTETKATAYEYGMPTPAELETASGKWWIADVEAPTKSLEAGDTMKMDHTYVAFFVIADNDPIFDRNNKDGVIVDPVALATTGALPDNGAVTGASDDDGGNSSGCTVGSMPSYDLLLLFLGLSAAALLRTLRRKAAK